MQPRMASKPVSPGYVQRDETNVADNPPPLAINAGNIVLVDDDDLFRESIGMNLIDHGFTVRQFPAAQPALDYFNEGGRADLILLDWKMPGMNGIDLLRQLRESKIDTPTIFLTALTDQVYEEAALGGGAVDFVEKSRSFGILLKRISLILGGVKAGGENGTDSTTDNLSLGDRELRLDISRAYWRGTQIDLTLTEFRIVHHLAHRPGQDTGYREIYDLVHGKDFIAGTGTDGFRSNVRTFIKRIRQKFAAVDPEFEAIENYAGFGYRWRAAEPG